MGNIRSLSEAQLVCLLFSPFTEQGAGLERFLRLCHPGMLVALPELHRAMQGHAVAEQIMHWMMDVSGLPVSLIGQLYRLQWTPQNDSVAPDVGLTLEDEWSAGH